MRICTPVLTCEELGHSPALARHRHELFSPGHRVAGIRALGAARQVQPELVEDEGVALCWVLHWKRK